MILLRSAAAVLLALASVDIDMAHVHAHAHAGSLRRSSNNHKQQGRDLAHRPFDEKVIIGKNGVEKVIKLKDKPLKVEEPSDEEPPEVEDEGDEEPIAENDPEEVDVPSAEDDPNEDPDDFAEDEGEEEPSEEDWEWEDLDGDGYINACVHIEGSVDWATVSLTIEEFGGLAISESVEGTCAEVCATMLDVCRCVDDECELVTGVDWSLYI